MIAAFIVLAIIIALALLGTYLKNNPAMIQVIFDSGTRVEWPLWLFTVRAVEVIIVAIVLFKIIWFIVRIPAISKRFGKKRRGLKAGQLLQKGMSEMGNGNWKQAEKTLSKGARISQAANQDAGLFLSAAAQAAQNLGADKRRDAYLLEARQLAVDGSDTFTASLAEAEMHLGNKAPTQALSVLKAHHSSNFGNERLLTLESQAYEQLGQFEDVWRLLNVLKKSFPSKEAFHARQKAVAQLLFTSIDTDLESVERVWAEMPKREKDENIMLAYTSALIHCGEHDKAEVFLAKQISNNYSQTLITAYTQLEAGSSRHRLSKFNRWLKNEPNNVYLNYGAAKFAFHSEEFEQARAFAECSVNIEPLPEALALLGKIYEAMGENNHALLAYRSSLGMTYRENSAISGEVLATPESTMLLTDNIENDNDGDDNDDNEINDDEINTQEKLDVVNEVNESDTQEKSAG